MINVMTPRDFVALTDREREIYTYGLVTGLSWISILFRVQAIDENGVLGPGSPVATDLRNRHDGELRHLVALHAFHIIYERPLAA
jgi:hypothetical protein